MPMLRVPIIRRNNNLLVILLLLDPNGPIPKTFKLLKVLFGTVIYKY